MIQLLLLRMEREQQQLLFLETFFRFLLLVELASIYICKYVIVL